MVLLETTISLFPRGVCLPNGKIRMISTPMQSVDLPMVYYYIRGIGAKYETEMIRSIDDHDKKQKYKKQLLLSVTFSGTFERRKKEKIIKESGLMVMDIDHLGSHEQLLVLKEKLIHDEVFETELLFVSPSGDGLKWVIYVGDRGGMAHETFYRLVVNYLKQKYDIEADATSDINRLCYLPHDPECYINPELLDNNNFNNK